MLQKVDIQQKFKFLKIRFWLVKGSKSNIVQKHCGPKTSFRPRIDPPPHSNHHHHHYHLPPLTPTTTTSTTTTQEANQTSSLSESFPLYYQLLQYVQSSVFPRNKHFLLNLTNLGRYAGVDASWHLTGLYMQQSRAAMFM